MNIKIGRYAFKIVAGTNKVTWEYINTGRWESKTLNILDSYLKADKSVVDLGAWCGVFSLYAAHNSSTVYAIEPDPICYSELLSNINQNPTIRSKIKPFPIAISDKIDKVSLSARETYGTSSSSILGRPRDKISDHIAHTLTLEAFIDQENISNVGFIKMDVEGAEFRILPAIQPALKKLHYPTLFISFHFRYLIENLYFNHVPSKMLSLILLKVESVFNFSFFEQRKKRISQGLFAGLTDYEFIYTSDGNRIDPANLHETVRNRESIDLVFSNERWIKA